MRLTDMPTQPISCNLCGNTCNFNKIAEMKGDTDPIGKGDVYSCQNCQLRFVNPLPSAEELTTVYSGLYQGRENYLTLDSHKQNITRKSFTGYLKILKKLGLGPYETLCDYGGGLGYYAEAAQHSGLKSTLMDLDSESAKFAKEVLGLNNAFIGTVDDYFQQQGHQYDIIFARHVIEHVPDPAHLIESLSKMLKKGGVLIIETPNNLSWEIMLRPFQLFKPFDFFKKYYLSINFISYFTNKLYAIRPPHHLYSFRFSNLENLLAQHDLDVKLSINYLTGDKVYWPNADIVNFKKLAKTLLKLDLPNFLLALLDTLSLPLRVLSKYCKRASGICIYAVKK